MELNNYKFTIAIIGKRKVGKSDLFYTIFKNERDGSSLPVEINKVYIIFWVKESKFKFGILVRIPVFNPC